MLTTFMIMPSRKAPTATQITYQPPGTKPEYQKVSPETRNGRAKHCHRHVPKLSQQEQKVCRRFGLSVNTNSSGIGSMHIYADMCIGERMERDMVLRTLKTDFTCLPTTPGEVSPNHCFLVLG